MNKEIIETLQKEVNKITADLIEHIRSTPRLYAEYFLQESSDPLEFARRCYHTITKLKEAIKLFEDENKSSEHGSS